MIMAEIRAVCFDAFGTVVEITDKRRPFRTLLRSEAESAAKRVLTHKIGLKDLSQEIAHSVGKANLARLEADLAVECASIRLRPGMDLIWATLQRAGVDIAICSNLAEPYVGPLIDSLPYTPYTFVFSCEVGLMKPQKEIFELVSSQLEIRLRQILFVGDSHEADIQGPIAAGALAMPISEFEASFASGPSIFAPKRIVNLFERIAAAKRTEKSASC
jgi:FMN phosphatase YigB (HAD superfamily)